LNTAHYPTKNLHPNAPMQRIKYPCTCTQIKKSPIVYLPSQPILITNTKVIHDVHKLNPTTTSPTSLTFILPIVFLTSLPTLVIHSLSSSASEVTSDWTIGLGAFKLLTNCWYRSDRSPKSTVAIAVVFEFNSLILIVFLVLVPWSLEKRVYSRVRSTICFNDSSSRMEACRLRCGPGCCIILQHQNIISKSTYRLCSWLRRGCRSPVWGSIMIQRLRRDQYLVFLIRTWATTPAAGLSHFKECQGSSSESANRKGD